MKTATTAAEVRNFLKPLQKNGKRVAFVPTMGCLHSAHMSLVKKARSVADIVVVSIYINPLQFGPHEDFDRYPRTFESDSNLCDKAGVDLIFHPTTLYPEGSPQTTVKAGKLSDCLCGTSRLGHFDGVATVVNILLNIVQPDIAIFGEKDWQQLAIIRRMASDLQLPVEIIGSKTVREADGLAMSSRNRYLSKGDRAKATALSKALLSMQSMAAKGERSVKQLKSTATSTLTAAAIKAEYLDIRSADNLEAKDELNDLPARAFIAAKVGSTRLIDNIPLILGPLSPEDCK